MTHRPPAPKHVWVIICGVHGPVGVEKTRDEARALAKCLDCEGATLRIEGYVPERKELRR